MVVDFTQFALPCCWEKINISIKCPCCETAFSGVWMAQFEVLLTPRMEEDVSSMKKRLDSEAPLKSSELIYVSEHWVS